MNTLGRLAVRVLCLGLTQCLGAPASPPKLELDAGADAAGRPEVGPVGVVDVGWPRDASRADQGVVADALPVPDGTTGDGSQADAHGADGRIADAQLPDIGASDLGLVDGRGDAASVPDAALNCTPDSIEPCGTDTGECDPGERICSPAGIWGSCEGALGPADETCNGRDDDCDGGTDEGLTQPCGVGSGVCEFGAQRCEGGQWGACDEHAGPQPEVCDGVDNDCDGETDEDYQPVVVCGVGACATDSVPSACEAGAVVPCQPGIEALDDTTCDGIDDDCDGGVDEDYLVLAACGAGACRALSAASNCVDGLETLCVPGAPLAPEDTTCDGVDNDCDGLVDDEYVPTQGCGVGECAGTSRPSTCVGGHETECVPGQPDASDATCDNVDNDCSGQVDEDYVVVPTCGDGECGAHATASSCVGGRETLCFPGPGQAEICDGLDNDCDGMVDDGNPGGDLACNTEQSGVCAAGTSVCAEGQVRCDADVADADETCDGLDNDCDGLVDEAAIGGLLSRACYDGAPDTRNVGICRGGTQTCGVGQYGACIGEIVPAVEICDGLDNNCDGATDNLADGGSCACQPGQQRACYSGVAGTEGVGVCHAGTQICDAEGLGWGACASEIAPGVEQCNGRDDNCNGTVDDAAGVGMQCSSGQGGCRRDGQRLCDAATGQIVCGAVPVEPAAETCDGWDNDCDGVVDNGDPGAGAACNTGGQGVCAAGLTSCQNGDLACSQQRQETAEVCDALDNDCNGAVDNGNPGGGAACNTALAGRCSAGTRMCRDGSLSCVQNAQAVAETCNRVDDDCDGQVDEGLVGVPQGWVCVPATGPGGFAMGSPVGEPGRGIKETLHQVTLTRPFALKATEVTQGEWQALMGDNPSLFFGCGAECPVERVNWYESVAYCNALSLSHGLARCYADGAGADYDRTDATNRVTPVVRNGLLDCAGYRLPTEAEWEYAARAGTAAASYNGAVSDVACGFDGSLDTIAWYCGNSAVNYAGCYDGSDFGGPACMGTHPVGLKRANSWGLYDMLGNVFEWNHDWYANYPAGASLDPQGPANGADRVYRGGSWTSTARYERAAGRYGHGPDVRDELFGLRPARSILP